MKIQELDTPAVLVDVDKLDANIRRLAAYCQEHNLQLRPHTKTHKNVWIAKRQIAAGAKGITVAKPGEAEVMVNGGIDDILIAYPIVGAKKARRVAELAKRAKIRVSLDSEQAAADLAQAATDAGVEVGILVEIDVGFARCGINNPEVAVALARQIAANPGTRFDGLMFYPGHLRKPVKEQEESIAVVNTVLENFYAAFRAAGIPLQVVSGGSTPTAFNSHLFHGITEIRPGMYAFLDRNMVAIGAGSVDDCAVSVLATVVSTAVSGKAMIDGGSKTFSSDAFSLGNKQGFGIVEEHPGCELVAFSEEHGHLDVTGCDKPLRVGERLRIIPNHVCTTINMHDRVYGIRGDEVVQEFNVDARGKLQ